MKLLFENWREYVKENIDLDIDVGDVLLGGKYKNKRIVVKDIGKDELGQPTVNGKGILKVRIEKHLPDSKKSKKTLDTEKEKLKENWRKFLNEGMKMPKDLPEGIQVRIIKEDDGQMRMAAFKLVNQETGEPPTEDEQRDKFGRIYGEVWISKRRDNKRGPCLGGWTIAVSKVASGFGPMLYDLAMEFATKNGEGLMADRTTVSKDAYFVWHIYNQDRHDDVESVQLDNLENELTPGFDALKTREATPEENEDNCKQASSYYWAKERGRPWEDTATARLYKKKNKNTEMYDKLKAAGKLYDETPI